MLVLIRS